MVDDQQERGGSCRTRLCAVFSSPTKVGNQWTDHRGTLQKGALLQCWLNFDSTTPKIGEMPKIVEWDDDLLVSAVIYEPIIVSFIRNENSPLPHSTLIDADIF